MKRTGMLESVVLGIVLLGGIVANADVRLAKIFTDNMMLQRDKPIRIWGWAAPGENVKVMLAGKAASVKADKDGCWLAELPAMQEGENLELTVIGNNTNVLKNVIMGDVWVCSGQSNMEMAFGNCNNAADVNAADFPKIRRIKVACKTSCIQEDDAPASIWQVCTPKTAGGFTAVGLYFAREVHQQTGVPVGLIDDNWGGTAIEPWISPEGMAMIPELAPAVSNRLSSLAAYKSELPKKCDEMDRWIAETRVALQKGSDLRPPPALPNHPFSGGWCSIYNAMIYPIVRFPITGALWYQGESNGGEGDSYFTKMQALISGWRKVWGQGDLPFYFVQLANYQQPNDNPAGGDGWARIRCAQTRALTIPKTGMALAIDIGDAGNIHPQNKYDLGIRLARWALARDYGRKDIVVSGPIFREMKIEGDKARLSFDYAESGLMVGLKKGRDPVAEDKEGKLQRFAVAGTNKVWQWASAVIDGKTVLVSSTNVPAPAAVRYGFSCNPQGLNLYNKEGLPASPFRTDEW